MKKTDFEVQVFGNAYNVDEIKNAVKDELKQNDIKLKSVADLGIYFKPEEQTVYFVARDSEGEELINSSFAI